LINTSVGFKTNKYDYKHEYGYAYHMRFLAGKHDQKTLSTMFNMQWVV